MQICPQCNYTNQNDATFCNSCGNHLQGVSDPLIDRIVNKYRIRERIGGGGFGSVYRAEHVELANSFAIKILHPHLIHNELMVERFRREAQLLAALRHPNIVQVVDFGQIDGLGLYLVMEWLEGHTLQWHIKHEGSPPTEILKEIFEQLLDALSYAHQQGVVHRDLKPDNLIWIPGTRRRRTIKVLDFGIARMLEKRGGSRLTESGLAVGTPRYMSPEQAAGEVEFIDHRTDIYACGVLLVEMLTGKALFTGTTNEILLHHMETPPPRLSDLAPDIRFPPALEWVLQRVLAKNPAQRFDSADAFADALFGVLEAEQTQIVRPSQVRPAPVRGALYPHHSGSPQAPVGMPSLGAVPVGVPVTPNPAHLPDPALQPDPAFQGAPAFQGVPVSATPSGPHVSPQAGSLPGPVLSPTRAITPTPNIPAPSLPPPAGSAGLSGVYRGEKQSGQHSRETSHRATASGVQGSNNWMWAAIGLVGGVGVALLFYIFGSLDTSGTKPLKPQLASKNRSIDLPTPPSLRIPDKRMGLPLVAHKSAHPPRVDQTTAHSTGVSPRARVQSPPSPRKQETNNLQVRDSQAHDANHLDSAPLDPPQVKKRKPRRVRRKRRRRWRSRRKRRVRKVRTARKARTIARRPAVPKAAWLTLQVISKPAKANVWVDSVLRGVTPLRIKVPASKTLMVRVSKEGFLSHHFKWTVKANGVKRVTLAPNIFR